MAQAGLFILIVTAAASAISAVQQGRAADAAGKHEAKILESDAQAAIDKAAFDERLSRERAAKLLGRQRAAAGASGITVEGSPLLVMAETAANAERDALAIRFGGAASAANLRNRAAAARFAGKQAKRAGIFKAIDPVLLGALVGESKGFGLGPSAQKSTGPTAASGAAGASAGSGAAPAIGSAAL